MQEAEAAWKALAQIALVFSVRVAKTFVNERQTRKGGCLARSCTAVAFNSFGFEWLVWYVHHRMVTLGAGEPLVTKTEESWLRQEKMLNLHRFPAYVDMTRLCIGELHTGTVKNC